MSSAPLILDTLQKSPLASPLMSPHKAMAAAGSAAIERPKHLTLDGQQQQQQQHVNVSPSPSSLSTAFGNISPGLSSAGSLSPSFLPEMPQWKRDLIQRRKQNVQRTMNASSPANTAAAAAASPSPLASPLAHGLKASTSSSSVRSLAGSNTNIDQVASDVLPYSPTKDFNKLSSSSAAAKVNKQHHATAAATAYGVPATIKPTLTNTTSISNSTSSSSSSSSTAAAAAAATSFNKEKSEKLFGGQYTATARTATVNTKEEITTKDQQQHHYQHPHPHPHHTHPHHQHHQQHQQHYQQRHTMEEEYLEKSKTTKEYHTTTPTTTTAATSPMAATARTIKNQNDEEEQKQERQEDDVRHITSTIKHTQQQQQQQHHQQMATRLTGSSSSSLATLTSSSSSSSASVSVSSCTSSTSTTSGALLNKTTARDSISLAEREPQHVGGFGFSITGANCGSPFQSSSRCESERLVCAANTTGTNTTIAAAATNTTTTATATVKISQKLQQNQFIKNEQQQKTKIIKFKATNNTPSSDLLLKSPTKLGATATAAATASSSSSSTSIAANNGVASNNFANSTYSNIKKMVAMQEMKKSPQNSATSHLHSNGRSNRSMVDAGVGASTHGPSDLDSNEDLSYGPGIVSKLRCRYLSLALRESMEQQRLNKNHLRRSTSLNNLLDDDDCGVDDQGDEDDDNETLGDEEDNNMGEQKNITENLMQKKSGILKMSGNTASATSSSCNAQEKSFTQGSNGVGVTFTETSFNKRSRHLKRGNDSLKRARSVEALLSEKSPWQPAVYRNSAMPTCVTIEDKIHNARERLQQGTDHLPPKRLTSIIDDTERPPPDLVKQTLKMFEASANRRPRCTNRSNSKGDVASKVETFKNIIKEQKPAVTSPKPTSPTKKLNMPPLMKPLKSATQASDLLQTPLGRKTLAVASSNSSSNTLSDYAPDIIPRQKLHTEREMGKEKFTTGINKEKFMNSLMEPPLTTNVVDSPLKSNIKEKLLGSVVDSPVSALMKDFEKLSLIDSAGNRKGDNLARNGGGGGGVGVVGGCGGVGGVEGLDDALHDNDRYNSKREEMNTNEFSSLKSETDKISETTTGNSNASNSTTATASEATVKAHAAPSSSDLSDGEDDDEYGISTTKLITRSALDNIAKAGTTQQFNFSTPASSSHHHTSATSSASVGGKQIGVIRPLLNTSSSAISTSSTATTVPHKPVNESNMATAKQPQHSSPSSLTSREIEKNRINDLKKSSLATASNCSPVGISATSSPLSASLDNVIKSSAAASGGYSDVDTVISATNSPLWAMRQRRQKPPAQPAENTSMVFNFSNRKEVPDYIENDGVIIRRKRELPKPNESGFVLLGDLSVETSTDMDYDDFSMCPPSPCDVEFENANIVIDGKSSIRQKSKDAKFRVQFNDTLTSTFEYPSEASLVVEDSFAEYVESELSQVLQNMVQASPHRVAGDDEDDSTHAIIPSVHHVADEIIQLPTTNESSSSSPANQQQQQSTKNILGNLPLDYPDLGRATPLTVVVADNKAGIKQENLNNNAVATPHQLSTQHLNMNNNNYNSILNTNNNTNVNTFSQSTELPMPLVSKKSRKDLNLPLLLDRDQTPPSKLPKPAHLTRQRCQKTQSQPQKMSSSKVNHNCKERRNSNDLNFTTSQAAKDTVAQVSSELAPQRQKFKEDPIQIITVSKDINTSGDNNKSHDMNNFNLENSKMLKPRQVSHVLNKPQYACFLQQTGKPRPHFLAPVQRSRSNEFEKSKDLAPLSSSSSVYRSSSLRAIEKIRSSATSADLNVNRANLSTSTEVATLFYPSDVNLNEKLTLSDGIVKPASFGTCIDETKNVEPLQNLTDHLAKTPTTDKITEEANLVMLATFKEEVVANTDSKRTEMLAGNITENFPTLTENNLNKFSDSKEDFKYHVHDCTGETDISSSTLDIKENSYFTVKHQFSQSVVNLTACDTTITENTTLSLPNLLEISNDVKEVAPYSTNLNESALTEYSVKITEPTTLSLPNLARTLTTSTTITNEQMSPPIHVAYLNTNLTEYTVNLTEQMTLSLPNLTQATFCSTEQLTESLPELDKSKVISADGYCRENSNELLEFVDAVDDITEHSDNSDVARCLPEQTENFTDSKESQENSAVNLKNSKFHLQLSVDSLDDFVDASMEPLECEDNALLPGVIKDQFGIVANSRGNPINSLEINENSKEMVINDISKESGEISNSNKNQENESKHVTTNQEEEAKCRSIESNQKTVKDNKENVYRLKDSLQEADKTFSKGSSNSQLNVRNLTPESNSTLKDVKQIEMLGSSKISNNPLNVTNTSVTSTDSKTAEAKSNCADDKINVNKTPPPLHKNVHKLQKAPSFDLSVKSVEKSVNLSNITLKKVIGFPKFMHGEKTPEIITEYPRFPQLKPTKRLAHLTDTKSKVIATYLYERASSEEVLRKPSVATETKSISSAAVGHKCNRNISSSFREALKLYESFNDNSKEREISRNKWSVQRSKSVTENSDRNNAKTSFNQEQRENSITATSQETNPNVASSPETSYCSLSENSLQYTDTSSFDDKVNANPAYKPHKVKTLETEFTHTINEGSASTLVTINPLNLPVFNSSPRPFRKQYNENENLGIVFDKQNLGSTLLPKLSPLLPVAFKRSPCSSPKCLRKPSPPVPQKPNSPHKLFTKGVASENTSHNVLPPNSSSSIHFAPSQMSSGIQSFESSSVKSCHSLHIPSLSTVSPDSLNKWNIKCSALSESRKSSPSNSYQISSYKTRYPLDSGCIAPNPTKISNKIQKDCLASASFKGNMSYEKNSPIAPFKPTSPGVKLHPISSNSTASHGRKCSEIVPSNVALEISGISLANSAIPSSCTTSDIKSDLPDSPLASFATQRSPMEEMKVSHLHNITINSNGSWRTPYAQSTVDSKISPPVNFDFTSTLPNQPSVSSSSSPLNILEKTNVSHVECKKPKIFSTIRPSDVRSSLLESPIVSPPNKLNFLGCQETSCITTDLNETYLEETQDLNAAYLEETQAVSTQLNFRQGKPSTSLNFGDFTKSFTVNREETQTDSAHVQTEFVKNLPELKGTSKSQTVTRADIHQNALNLATNHKSLALPTEFANSLVASNLDASAGSPLVSCSHQFSHFSSQRSESKSIHEPEQGLNTTHSSALPTTLQTVNIDTLTLHQTLPVKVTSTAPTRNFNMNNAFSSITNNNNNNNMKNNNHVIHEHEHLEVKGNNDDGGFPVKPMEFLKPTISCSSTFSSTSCTSSSSSSISTNIINNNCSTTTTTTVHATSRRIQPQRDVLLLLPSTIAPKVLPRRLFATPLQSAPKTCKSTAINNSNNNISKTNNGNIKTMTATSMCSKNTTTSSSSSSSSPFYKNNLKASPSTTTTTTYKFTNNTKTAITTTTTSTAITNSTTAVCAPPPLRRRIPGNTLYYV